MATTPTTKFKPFPPVESLNPGIEPLEFHVLVMMPDVQEKTSGGVLLADETKDHEGTAQTIAMIVELSPMAFSFSEWPRNPDGSLAFPEKLPKPGDTVRIKQYAGTTWQDEDGHWYRIVNDKDILGRFTRTPHRIVAEEPENKALAGRMIGAARG